MADKFKFNPFTGKFDITNTGDVTLASDSGLDLVNQVISLGEPSTITSSTINSVTGDTHTHEITGFIDLQFVTSDPLTGDEGSQILNTVDHQLKMMYAGEWQLIKQLKGLDYLKLQNGSFILLQNGSKFKQQVSI